MKKNATFTIDGNPHKVTVEAASDIVDKIGAERYISLFLGFGIAHWVQSSFKSAMSTINSGKEVRESTLKAAQELVDKVKNGEVLQLLDFVPAERGEDKDIVALRAKWPQASPEKRAAYLAAKGLAATLVSADAQAVVEALQAKKAELEAAEL